MMVGEGLCQVGREESVLMEGTGMQLPRLMSDPQCKISCPSVASKVVDKMPKISTFSGEPTQKGRSHLNGGVLK